MMIVPPTPLWTSEETAAAVKGELLGDKNWEANGVSIDSRTIEKGDIFIALKGVGNFDGHDYINEAFKKGAAACIISKEPEIIDNSKPLLLAEDTMTALNDLGQVGRMRSDAKIIAVTGSVGKTGTKEALKTAFSNFGLTYANIGSLNNHWGVPLSLARLPHGTKYGIFELGMNAAGEIRTLSKMVKPDIAIITTIAASHIEFFESEAHIADAKAEIFESMSPESTAIIPADSPHYPSLVAHARTAGISQILTFGEKPTADAQLIEALAVEDGSHVKAKINTEKIGYDVSLQGKHWAINSLAILLCGKAANIPLSEFTAPLSKLKALDGRGARHIIKTDNGSFTLIDESYNASPTSMKATLSVLANIPNNNGRNIAVIGDMLELGKDSISLHKSLAKNINNANIDLVLSCGSLMENLFEEISPDKKACHAKTAEELLPKLLDIIKDNDIIMVKGSYGMRMRHIITALKELNNNNNNKLPHKKHVL